MKTRTIAPTCPYCQHPAKKVTGRDIYPHRRDLQSLAFWQCAPCDAYVGCHKNGSGDMPLGRLANAELRAAKQAAHAAFDPMWRSGRMRRSTAYAWLSREMGIPTAECHIGMFDVDLCQRVVQLCVSRDFEVQE